jgi:hypothetical protein
MTCNSIQQLSPPAPEWEDHSLSTVSPTPRLSSPSLPHCPSKMPLDWAWQGSRLVRRCGNIALMAWVYHFPKSHWHFVVAIGRKVHLLVLSRLISFDRTNEMVVGD